MKKELGQYMTPIEIVDFMIDLISKNSDAKILEPSSGEGIFINRLIDNEFKNIVGVEIDNDLIETNSKAGRHVRNESFVSAEFDEKFDVVIGNPPYVRWKNMNSLLKEEIQQNDLFKKHMNSLMDYSNFFILKSIELLKENGELIFITPDYWLSTTHSLALRDYMSSHGYFENIVLLKEVRAFKDATVSLLIFKYIKSEDRSRHPKNIKISEYPDKTLSTNTLYEIINDSSQHCYYIEQFNPDKPWEIYRKEERYKIRSLELAVEKNPRNIRVVGDVSQIGNGMVSGLDKVFQIKDFDLLNKTEQQNSINVLKGKNLEGFSFNEITKYIFIKDEINEEQLISLMPNYYNKLLPFKKQLNSRYNYNKDIKYWEWVFLRNYTLFLKPVEKIFVPGKERISNKNYFRFTKVPPNIFATQDVTTIVPSENIVESIDYFVAYLNSEFVFTWMKNRGIVKGHIVEFSERPLSNTPYIAINFEDKLEKNIHDKISKIASKKYLNTQDKEDINLLFENLIIHRVQKDLY